MLNVIKTLLLQGWRIILNYFTWILKAAKKGKEIPMEEKYAKLRKLGLHVMKSLNGDITVVGKENIPEGTCCFFSNHINLSDPLIYIVSIEKPMTFVCKKEIQQIPVINKCVLAIEGEYIDRENLKASLRTMMKVQADLESGRKNWLIFPEGTRNRDDHRLMLPFHHGTFRSPMKAGVPLVPCCLYGTQRLISKKQNFKRYPIYLEIGKPMMPEEYKDLETVEVARIMQSRIQAMISYHARQHDKKELVKLLGDKYKENY